MAAKCRGLLHDSCERLSDVGLEDVKRVMPPSATLFDATESHANLSRMQGKTPIMKGRLGSN